MLMAAGYEPPQRLFIHGMLLGSDGYAMSKTRGTGVDPFGAIERYGSDALRYYLLREVAFGSDGASATTAAPALPGDLANDLGNLVAAQSR